METAYHVLFVGTLGVLAVLLFACLIRSILGPKIADRLVAVNMIGTMTIIALSVLALFLNEGGLMDVALIYPMLSFLAVVLLSKVYLGSYLESKRKKAEEEKKDA